MELARLVEREPINGQASDQEEAATLAHGAVTTDYLPLCACRSGFG